MFFQTHHHCRIARLHSVWPQPLARKRPPFRKSHCSQKETVLTGQTESHSRKGIVLTGMWLSLLPALTRCSFFRFFLCWRGVCSPLIPALARRRFRFAYLSVRGNACFFGFYCTCGFLSPFSDKTEWRWVCRLFRERRQCCGRQQVFDVCGGPCACPCATPRGVAGFAWTPLGYRYGSPMGFSNARGRDQLLSFFELTIMANSP